jgi:hypothetical protein
MKIDDVIAAATEELNCSYEANALWFEVLINQAFRSHKTMNKLEMKQVILKVMDNKIQIPVDWSRLVSVYHCDSGEKYCPDIDYSVQNDTIIFNSALALPTGARIYVHYYGLRTDEHGLIVIPNDWERMLVAYIGWKYTRRYIKDFGVAVMQNYQREYQTQKLANV